jgi:His-Xaa-Ser system protein HxsD
VIELTISADASTAQTAIDLRVHRLTAVKKAAYRLAKHFTVTLGSPETDLLQVTFLFPNKVTESSARELVRRFYEELLDQDLREQIAEETGPLRALLLAHAFSKTGLIREP